MDKQQTKEAIEIMQHWVDGGEVEVRLRTVEGGDMDGWVSCTVETKWLWNNHEYRIKKEPLEIYYLVDDKGDYFNHYGIDRLADAEKVAEYMGLNIIKMREVVE